MQRWIVLILSLILSTTNFAEGNAQQGKIKSETCVACHGVDGNNENSATGPKIAGQYAQYLKKQLLEFRKGNQGGRFDPVMEGFAQSLSDQDIEDVVAYFSEQNVTLGTVKKELLALGEKIYRGGNAKTGVAACSSCHDPHGLGNPLAGIPRLGGQHADYIMAQLKKYRNGERKTDVNNIMQDISKRLSEEEMQAVSSYVSGLH